MGADETGTATLARPSAGKPLRRLLLLTWSMLVLVASWLPARHLPPGEQIPGIPNLDKLIHVLLFVPIGILGLWTGPSAGRATWVLVGGMALAALSEAGQGMEFVHREPSLNDGLADGLGLLIGMAAALAVGARRRRLG